MKVYKLVRRGQVYALTVPPEVGEKMVGRYFTCVVTEEGILYRLVPDQPDSPPTWLNGDR